MRFRSYIFLALVLFLISVIFSSCEPASDTVASDSINFSVPDWNGNAVTWGDVSSSAEHIFKLDSNTKTVQFRQPARVQMSKLNVSDTTVPSTQTQYVTNSSNRNASTLNDEEFDVKYEGRIDYAPARDFIPPTEKEIAAMLAKNASMRGAGMLGDSKSNRNSLSPAEFIENETTKYLYLDDSTQYEATLRAKGSNCLVWVVNEYYDVSVNGDKINSTIAKTLATEFDMIYQLVREVFGEESEVILDAGNISTASDTGSMVNIVIYDIDGDYSSSQKGGVFGFFWAKDYYPQSVFRNSNIGKYFYVDSYFSHKSETSKKEMYSTLVHEFQHMINFNQKFIKHNGNLSSPTWYNEMLSMMAEDMMQQKLGISNDLILNSRLPKFCEGYYLSGITDWLDGDGVYYSYAVNAIFGAYLARAYGGAKLAYEMSHNNSVGFQSIIQAIKASTGETVTEEELLRDFAHNIVSPSASCALNKDLAESKPNNNYAKDYKFPLKAVDVHSYRWAGGTGPKLFHGNRQKEIRPYGIVLHDIGTVNNISFSSYVNSNAKVYLFAKN